MRADDTPTVAGNPRVGDGVVDHCVCLICPPSFVEIRAIDAKIRFPIEQGAKLAEKAIAGGGFDVEFDGRVRAFGHRPKKRLDKSETLFRRMAKLGKQKTGLPFGSERENTIGQIEYRHVHDVEITSLDRADATEREINLFGVKLR